MDLCDSSFFFPFSHWFIHSIDLCLAYKEDLDEMEMDMEIGCPTDVKHVTHIGWDGAATPNPIMGWDNLISPDLMSVPSVSLEQFELSSARQADAPLINGWT